MLRILLLSILIATFAGLFFSLQKSNFFSVKEIQIQWDAEIPKDQLSFFETRQQQLNEQLKTYLNQPIWKINLATISQKISEEQWIAEFQIQKTWPANIELQIKPHLIRFVIRKNSTQFFPMIDNGVILPFVMNEKLISTPILISETKTAKAELKVQAQQLWKQLPQLGAFSLSSIHELHANNKGFWAKLNKDNLQIKLGEGDFEQKVLRLNQVLNYLEQKQLKAESLDADLSRKVIVRLKDSTNLDSH